MNPQKSRQQRRKRAQAPKRREAYIASSLSNVALTSSMIREFIDIVAAEGLPILQAIGYKAEAALSYLDRAQRAEQALKDCQELIDLHRMRQVNPSFKLPERNLERRGTKPRLSWKLVK